MVSGVRELTRTLLYATCIFGLWFPIVWLVGAVWVMRTLRVAPPSDYKRGMHVSFGLVLFMLVAFAIAAAVAGITVPTFEMIPGAPLPFDFASSVNDRWHLNLQIISGFMLTLYAMCGLVFVAFADATFRSTAGPVVNELRSPRFLRGVHLGLNLSGMLLPMPLFSLVGIPITLYRIRAMRQQNTGVAVFVFGVLTFVAMVAFTLLVIVGALMPTAENRTDDNATTRAKVEMGCFNRARPSLEWRHPFQLTIVPNSPSLDRYAGWC